MIIESRGGIKGVFEAASVFGVRVCVYGHIRKGDQVSISQQTKLPRSAGVLSCGEGGLPTHSGKNSYTSTCLTNLVLNFLLCAVFAISPSTNYD